MLVPYCSSHAAVEPLEVPPIERTPNSLLPEKRPEKFLRIEKIQDKGYRSATMAQDPLAGAAAAFLAASPGTENYPGLAQQMLQSIAGMGLRGLDARSGPEQRRILYALTVARRVYDAWENEEIKSTDFLWMDNIHELGRVANDLMERVDLQSTEVEEVACAAARAWRAVEGLAGQTLAHIRDAVWRACFGGHTLYRAWNLRDLLREQSVMILGETGTGKEAVADTIANAALPPAARRDPKNAMSYAAINVAAIPDELAEAEFFGHERGAFTGAGAQRIGAIETAGAGILFLDELGDVSPRLQPKLLRVLEARRFKRIGGTTEIGTAARWVSATSKDVDGMVRAEAFRSDLYFRLANVRIQLPPLRELPPSDVIRIANVMLDRLSPKAPKFNTDLGHRSLKEQILPELMDLLSVRRAWPGNARELYSILRNACVAGVESARAEIQRVPILSQMPIRPIRSVDAVEWDVLNCTASRARVEAWYTRRLFERISVSQGHAPEGDSIRVPEIYRKVINEMAKVLRVERQTAEAMLERASRSSE